MLRLAIPLRSASFSAVVRAVLLELDRAGLGTSTFDRPLVLGPLLICPVTRALGHFLDVLENTSQRAEVTLNESERTEAITLAGEIREALQMVEEPIRAGVFR